MQNDYRRGMQLDDDELERLYEYAELQKPPKPDYEPKKNPLWAGACLLTMFAALGYLFWRAV